MLKNILFLTDKKNYYVIEKRKFFILVVFFIVTDAHSQQLSMQVIVPTAGVILSSGYNYSQTIGEAAVEIVSSTDYVLTQGFQQPPVKFIDIQHNGNGVNVYPNPAVDYVKVELFGDIAREYRISIINITGTIVHSDDLIFGEKFWHVQEIPVSDLVRGFYFVRVLSKDGVISRTFKIEKM
jgi:hypothetical protein